MRADIPAQYKWLAATAAPFMVAEALDLYGTKEKIGPENNPVIMRWAADIGLAKDYTGDSIPWCGLFMGIVAKRAQKELPDNPLWALNWAKFGMHSPVPMLGDVLTFQRNGGGHVALYVGEDTMAYHVIGGNQGDAVSIVRIAKERLHSVRRPLYHQQPDSVRVIHLASNGVLSTHEQ